MKIFEEPTIVVVDFAVEDIIAVSPVGGIDTPLKPNQSPWG